MSYRLILGTLPHGMKSGLAILECCLLIWACPGSRDELSLLVAVNVSSLVHIAHTVLLLPREEICRGQGNTVKAHQKIKHLLCTCVYHSL